MTVFIDDYTRGFLAAAVSIAHDDVMICDSQPIKVLYSSIIALLGVQIKSVEEIVKEREEEEDKKNKANNTTNDVCSLFKPISDI